MRVRNLLTDVKESNYEELTDVLAETGSFRIERIVSTGQSTPEGDWYELEQNEWVMVLKGAAKLRFEEQTIEMIPGDFVNIPAYRLHRVDWTTPFEPTIWLAVHYDD
jgi:cupin 2 domain-containing protein